MLQSILRRWFSLKLHKNKINCFIVRKNQIQQHNVQEGTYNTIKELYLFYSSSLIIICWCWSSHLLIFILTQKLFSSDKTSLFSRDTRTKLELLIKNKNATEKKASNVLLSLIWKKKQNMFLIILYCKIVLRVLIKKIWPDPYLKSRFLFVAHY